MIATLVSAAPCLAANVAIGVATAVNALSVNNASVTGNVDVFDGSQIRTMIAPGDVHLDTGVDVRFATRSAGTVYRDHMLLRQGAVRVANFDRYAVNAEDLQIQAEAPGAAAIVRTTGKTVEVASIGGAVTVTDGAVMLTRVAAGNKMSFQTQSSGANSGQTGAAPGKTGTAPAEKGPMSDKKAFLWAAGVCGVGAIIVGSIAASQGKSPF